MVYIISTYMVTVLVNESVVLKNAKCVRMQCEVYICFNQRMFVCITRPLGPNKHPSNKWLNPFTSELVGVGQCFAWHMSPSVDYFLSFFYILRLTLNPQHSHCNIMARIGTILVFYLFFHDFIANFPHIMTSFLVMVKGSHSLFGIYLRSEDS